MKTEGCIVATKGGWMIASKLNLETEKYWMVTYIDEPHYLHKIYKSDSRKQVFKNVDEAFNWIEGN